MPEERSPTEAALEKFLRSPEAKRAIAAEEQRRDQRRAAAAERLKHDLVEAGREQVAALEQLSARIEVATADFAEKQTAFVQAQNALTSLLRQRIRQSFSGDVIVAELTARLRAVRDGTANMDND